MRPLYNLAILAYGLAIKLAIPFHEKARKFVKGRKSQRRIWKEKHEGQWAWFHVSSLGEFEQGKPVISRFKNAYPNWKILLTFFSPSGYEVKSNDPIADLIGYLPLDTPQNARRLVEAFDLQIACFVKYDFWLNYLTALHHRNIPIILISGIFRKDQWFFKPWGSFYRSFLFYFDRILVQNVESSNLLQSIGYQHYQVTGDTRFDRVWSIQEGGQVLETITSFKGESLLIVFGSTWAGDHQIIIPVMEELTRAGVSVIIAPHQISHTDINSLQKNIHLPNRLFSKIGQNEINEDVLIIDRIGLLANIYRYADLAYVGGAFKGTLHNILEPAVAGIPVLIGRHQSNQKFQEASDLMELGGVREVESSKELLSQLNLLLYDPERRSTIGRLCKAYVDEHRGATEKTMSVIQELVEKKS